MKASKFRKRYVIGVGYALSFDGRISLHKTVAVTKKSRIKLTIPPELWKTSTPRYRLVLERVAERRKPHEGK